MPTSSSNQTTKVATLTLPTHDTRLTALVWPSPSGTLVFLAELNLAVPTAQEFMAALTGALETKWQELASLNLPPDAALEQILLAINRTLLMYGRLLGNPLAPRYHLALAIVQGQAVALSSLGYISTLLTSSDHLTNISQSTPRDRGRRLTKPTFENLSCGQIESGETFIISSISLLDYFTIDKIKHLFNEHLPGAALREIEQFTASLPHHSPLGVIALKFQQPAVVSGTAPSMNHLLATKIQTAEMLKPSLGAWFKKFWKRPRRPSPENQLPEIAAISSAPAVITPPVKPRRQLQLRKQLTNLNLKLQTTFAKLAWLKNRTTIKQTISWWLEIKIVWWQNLKINHRLILIIAWLLLTVFCQSIVTSGKNQLKQADNDRYNLLLTRLTENEAAAQAAMIYRDDKKAQDYLLAAQKLLAELPQNTGLRTNQYQALNNNLQALWRRLNRETALTALTPWYNLLESSKPSIALAWQKNSLWLTSVSSITSLNAAGRVNKTIKLPADFGNTQLAAISDSALLIQSDSNKQLTIDLASGQITKLEKVQLMKDANFYQNKLYYLNQKTTSLYRTTLQNNQLAGATNWLRTTDNNLSGAKSLAVDGAIYVIWPDKIAKFKNGRKQDFAIQTIAPLKPYDLIRTSGEIDYLYLLNKSDKAIALVDKQGKLAARLLFPELQSINSLAVDSAKQILYVADNTAVYQIEFAAYLK
ncbi:MAG: hypothetical protein HY973_03255 [Candidatus Kerfeldbacteria bacterium]|nr:hypothetical protein [Candidatus Kerfeldbacteria bacterium]